MFSESGIHAILISETWLNEDIPSSLLSIPGFRLFRNDRKNRRGGGVAIYISEWLKVKQIGSSSSQPIEFLCLEVDSGNDKCVLSCVYCPPNCFSNDSAREFEGSMSRLTQSYTNVIVGGDFNVNLYRQDALTNQFSHFLHSVHLNTINSVPTYYNTDNPSLLDLILVSDENKIISNNQISPPSTLDHDILFFSYDYSLDTRPPLNFTYRNYKNLDMNALADECRQQPWDSIFYCATVHQQVEIFSSLSTYLYEKYVPLRMKKVTIRDCPWFTQSVRSLIAEREFLYRRFRRLRTDEARQLYKVSRNKTNMAIRQAKLRYFRSKLSTDLPPRVLWRNLKQTGVYGKDKPECGFNPEELNTFFSSSNNLLSGFPNMTQANSVNLELGMPTDFTTSFSFRSVDYAELVSSIFSIKSEATGPDNLAPRFIKLLLPLVGRYILHIVNTCLMSSTFPNQWKIATVLPIAKKSLPESTADFRPISILCFLSKITEKIIYRQMLDYIEGNDLLASWQSGFRPSHSCETAILKVTSDIRGALDQDNFTALVLLDFSKAFDSVDHCILLHKLATVYNFSASAVSLIRNFLVGRGQRVKVNDVLSSLAFLECGVPQGSVLGPLLFSLFINDLPDVVRDVRVHLYADDVQLYLSRPIGLLEDCIARVNNDLHRICLWSEHNRLLLNPSKSQCITFYSGVLDDSDIPQVELKGYALPFQGKVVSLGMVLNRNMKCCDNVTRVVGKVYAGLRRLWLSADVLPRSMRLRLIKSLILPHFTFGSTVFPKMDSICTRKLEVAFNDCIRFIFGLRRFDHVSPFRDSLLGCSLASYLSQRALVFLYNLLSSNRPGYLRDFFCFTTSQRNRNLVIPRFHKSVMESSYLVQISRLWNCLPPSVQSVGTVSAFKRLIKSFIL